MNRLVRLLLGLPYHKGVYTPLNPDNSDTKVGKYVWDEAAEAAARGVRPQEEGGGKVADEAPDPTWEERSHTGLMDQRMMTNGTNMYDAYMSPECGPDMMLEGDLATFSSGLAEDVWHVLTTELTWSRMLMLELLMEAVLVVTFAVLMFAASYVAESSAGGGSATATAAGELFLSKLLLAFSTVRISSDAIFGWAPRAQSSSAEILLVALLGWLHWLLITVASALIVGRALKPQQQLVFAPDCTISAVTYNGQRVLELAVKVAVLRTWHYPVLQNVELKLEIARLGDGACYPLPLKGGITGFPQMATVVPIYLRHILDERSPIMQQGGPEKMFFLMAHVSAEDTFGTRISQSMRYCNPDGPTPRRYANAGFSPCRILFGATFASQMRMLRSPDGTPTPSIPRVFLNVDNFHHVKRDPDAQAVLQQLKTRMGLA